MFSGVRDDMLLSFVPMESISDTHGVIIVAKYRPFSENIGYTNFQEGDLLWAKITPCMENGKSAVAQNLLNGYGFGSTEYHVLRPKINGLSIRYLHFLLRLNSVREAATNYFGGSSGHQRVDEAFFSRLHIPLPNISVQDQIVAELDKQELLAKSKRETAVNLLAGIDNYLLAELGITLPPEPESTIAKRIFTAQRRELAGWRFDPLFHSFKLWHAIEEAYVPHKKLGLCCHYLKSGFAAGGTMQLFDDNGVIQLRPTNLNADRELVFDRNVYLDKALLLERPTDVVQYGEVLFNNTNSQELVGKTAYMNIEEQPFFCSNHMTRIRTIETELHPEYLTALLNTYQRLKVFFSLCTNWNNQSGVNVDSLRQLPIPVPDMGKQTVIATHIGNIRQEAKLLRQQAQTELETAKRRIEVMLLGEEP